MPTAVFDIDGTLTDTNSVDHECYVAAVYDVLGVRVGEDWGGTQDVTDSNILRELWANTHAEPVPRSIEQKVVARFLDRLEHEADEHPDRFHPIAGATQVFSRVIALGWAPAIATGGWRPSARLKLASASIPFAGVPLASASEHVRRVEIIEHALSLCADGSSRRMAVYFGDRSWDLRAARALGIAFIGVGKGEAADQLRDAGAPVVLPDLNDASLLRELLTAASKHAM